MLADWADLEDRDVAERDPDTIKRDIDVARDQLASTVDSLAETGRADPNKTVAVEVRTCAPTRAASPTTSRSG